MKNTLGRPAHPSFFLASTTAIVGAPSMDAPSSRHGWDCTTARTTSAAAILTSQNGDWWKIIAFRVLADNQPNIRTIGVVFPQQLAGSTNCRSRNST
jgi:hypothetical protein